MDNEVKRVIITRVKEAQRSPERKVKVKYFLKGYINAMEAVKVISPPEYLEMLKHINREL